LISATFDRPMNPATITGASFTLVNGSAPVTGSVFLSATGTVATFIPDVILAANTTYLATITTAARDTAGTPLAASFSWSFTTGTGTIQLGSSPRVISSVPVNLATGVSVTTAISATFSKAMDPLTITGQTFSISRGASQVAGTVTLDAAGTTATFTPVVQLVSNTTYTATISTGAKDTTGIPLDAAFSWQFTTGTSGDTVPPAVTTVAPLSGTTGVARSTAIVATFSEAVDPLTVTGQTFTVSSGTTPVTGTVTLSANGTVATFVPGALLTPSTAYTATVTTGVRDLSGNPLTVNNSWNFTTGP
jgi:Big-like domain-containing protein